MLRTARTLAVLATIAAVGSCQTVNDPFPPQATLNFDISNSQVASQLAPLPAPQIVAWKIEEASVSDLTGFDGTHSFLYSGPCSYRLSSSAPVSFGASCRTSGLTLTPGTEVRSAKLRTTISRLELRTAARPDLSSSADPDGDGIPNSADNCPIVYNPDQANVNPDQEVVSVGDACSDDDTEGKPTIADQDLDGVADAIDNCLWYPSPAATGSAAPPDGNQDGIGDACERIAPVILPGGKLAIECDAVTFTAEPSKAAFFRMDFGRQGVLTCDSGFTGCAIDPTAIKVGLLGVTQTFSCHAAP